MIYPRIFSLSTVGILRHYNQDYMIHETRTDFTGSNGTGKSMIADLLQIIFIPYRKHIKFGTEGIKGRLLSKMPYEVNEAYTFLNIEVAQDRFITVGTCISQTEKGSPTPFLILKNADTHKKLHELSYSEGCIPLHSHFIENNCVVGLKDLARHFRDNYQLYFNAYGAPEKKNELFSFLYNQEILPINLSIEDNLKAFAKVIQSFSRAKSLNVNDSKSLKAFLFEDEAIYDQAFRKHKDDLQGLLIDYKRLENDIEVLVQKQSQLGNLKKLEGIFKDTEKDFFILDYKFSVQAMNIAREKYEKAKQELDNTQQEIDLVKKRKPKLERLLEISDTQIDKYKKALDILRDYADKYKELPRIQNEISELITADVPDIDENIPIDKEATKIDITQLDHKEILQRIAKFKSVYQRYGSFAAMDTQYHKQSEILEEQIRALQADIQQFEELIKLLSSDKGLFAKVMERGKSLSEEQEAALFHLLDVHWQKPDKVKTGERFTETLQVLDIDNIETDEHNSGFWLRLGHLREFFPKRQEQLLNNPDTFEKVLQNKVDSFKVKLKTAKMHLIELRQFQHGEVSTVSFLQLDPDLRDATSFINLKQNAVITQNIGQKIDFLRSQEQIKVEELRKLKEQIPFNVKPNDIDRQYLDKQQQVLQRKEIRRKKISDKKIEEDARYKLLSNVVLKSRIEKHEGEKNAYQDVQLTYHEKENERLGLQIQVEIDDQENITKEALKNLKSTLDDAKTNYQNKYRDISNYFQETNEGNDPEIKEQIDDKRYEFSMLEHVLLGPKIKHVDNLPDVLRESNRQREKIAHSIYASMVRIFSETKETFESHQSVVRGLNSFFKHKRISGKYAFYINFTKRTDIDIAWIDDLSAQLLNIYQPGELPFGESVESFVEDFFKQVSGYKRNIDVHDLLDPKTYFDLSVSLRDDNGKDYSGSTGEAYSAIVLLGIGRLSRVQRQERRGLRFVILEETANLDQTNFNHFPEIAQEFGYQIITMTPQPYGSDSEEGWYLYHLLPSKGQADINSEPLGYFKTNRNHKDLKTYLKALEKRR